MDEDVFTLIRNEVEILRQRVVDGGESPAVPIDTKVIATMMLCHAAALYAQTMAVA